MSRHKTKLERSSHQATLKESTKRSKVSKRSLPTKLMMMSQTKRNLSTIQRTFRWAGTASRFHIGSISFTVSEKNTSARYVVELVIGDDGRLRSISKSGDMPTE